MDLDVVQGVRKTTLENIVIVTVTKISSNTTEIRIRGTLMMTSSRRSGHPIYDLVLFYSLVKVFMF